MLRNFVRLTYFEKVTKKRNVFKLNYIFPEEMKATYILKDMKLSLSPLELDILSLFSHDKEYLVKEVYNQIKKRRKVATSSVPVILDRLFSKGLVDRRAETCRGGVRYAYSLKKDKSQYEKSVVEAVINKLIEKFGQNALSYFDERFPKTKKVK